MYSKEQPARSSSRAGYTRPSWHAWLPLVIVLAATAAYLTSFDGVFLFDEDRRIVNNERIRQLWPLGDLLSGRRPVVDLTLATNYRIGELSVTSYHALNLAIHIAAALTLFGIVRRTVGRTLEQDSVLHGGVSPAGHPPTHGNPRGLKPAAQDVQMGTTPKPAARRTAAGEAVAQASYRCRASWLALAVALIWVVHPLQTQSVAYIIQRSESLMGLFYLLALYAVIRGVETPPGWKWNTIAIACCAAGMGSKAVMVTAPVTVLLFDMCFLARSPREALRQRWGLYLGLAATWGVLFAIGVGQSVLSSAPNNVAHVGFGFKGVTPWEYLASQPGVIVHYLRLALWPHPLCLDYYWPIARSVEAIMLPLLVIGPLLAGTVWALWRRPPLGFLGVWFFLILAPTSSFIPIKDLAYEHRMYLPLAAVVTLMVLIGNGAIELAFDRSPRRAALRPWLAGVLVVTVLACLAVTTARRNKVYHSELAMWQDVAAIRPLNPRAHDSLGIAMEELGRLDEAEREYREAVRVDPAYANAHNNLGSLLDQRGRVDEAIDQYRQALHVDPLHLYARINLGDALARRGLIDEGIAELRRTLQGSPEHPVALYALGNALSARGELDEAADCYRRVLRAEPAYAEAYYSLGNALRDRGDLEDAVEAFRGALRIDPGFVSAHNNLGSVLLRLQRFDEAIAELRETLRLQPRHMGARRNLERALEYQRQTADP